MTLRDKPKPGDRVVLTSVPPELLSGLPAEERKAISGAVGQPMLLVGYDADGKAEVQFTDAAGIIHYIYVQPTAIETANHPSAVYDSIGHGGKELPSATSRRDVFAISIRSLGREQPVSEVTQDNLSAILSVVSEVEMPTA